jgi:hypothetical protein
MDERIRASSGRTEATFAKTLRHVSTCRAALADRLPCLTL